ncbi:MAG: HK97 gp10 family phage protein [Balneolaceae bacterium]
MAKSFALQIKDFGDKVNDRMDVVVKKTMLEIHMGVVMTTPVDTGRARANWNVGLNNVDASVSPPGNLQQVLNRASALISKIKAGDVIYISNNVEYIEALEDGHSKQHPNGMVAVTLRRFNHIVEKSITEAKKEHP